MEKMGLPLPEYDELRSFIGPPLMESFMRVGHLDEEAATRAVALYRERFAVTGWKENAVYRGIPALLKELKRRGAYIAVATSKPGTYSGRILEHFGLAPYVDQLEAITLTNHHADKAELVRRALPARFTRACMVGDRAYDMEGAVANQIDGVGVTYGYGTYEELEKAGAYAIAASVEELALILLDGELPQEKGRFITFEGSDGCGKSTQARLAAKWLAMSGYEVVTTREPGGCMISERIREILLDVKSAGMSNECEALLYAAARAQHVSEVIAPALRRGAIVVCDRFVDSSVAYQGGGRNLGRELVERINEPAIGGYMPDLTLMYNLPPMKAMHRRLSASQPDRLELEKQAFVERVYETYLEIAAAHPERVTLIDGDRSIEEIELETRRVLIQHLAQ